jgi:hypothetical protein
MIGGRGRSFVRRRERLIEGGRRCPGSNGERTTIVRSVHLIGGDSCPKTCISRRRCSQWHLCHRRSVSWLRRLLSGIQA